MPAHGRLLTEEIATRDRVGGCVSNVKVPITVKLPVLNKIVAGLSTKVMGQSLNLQRSRMCETCLQV